MVSSATKTCVICYGERYKVSGHVHKGAEVILASVCKEHSGETLSLAPPKPGVCKGCYGEWTAPMGIEENFLPIHNYMKTPPDLIKRKKFHILWPLKKFLKK